jgi:hypothetical protein
LHKETPNDVCLLLGEMSDEVALQVFSAISGEHSRYNGVIFWEMQLNQDYDKVLKFDEYVSYFNISVHTGDSQYDQVFWVKMV